MREIIKDFYGKQIGSIETLPNGDKIARDFYNVILGKYVKSENVTKDFMGRKLTLGDTVIGLIWQKEIEKKK